MLFKELFKEAISTNFEMTERTFQRRLRERRPERQINSRLVIYLDK